MNTQPMNTLLVVDDDPGLRMQLKWTFDRYRVAVAADRLARRAVPAVRTIAAGY